MSADCSRRWLATFAGTAMSWTRAGNTSGQAGSPWNFGNISTGCPFFTGDFTGSGKTEVMFYYPGDGNWWLATFAGTAMSWQLKGNTAGFGNISSCPFWTGDFTGVSHAQVMFYYSGGEKNWWLGSLP